MSAHPESSRRLKLGLWLTVWAAVALLGLAVVALIYRTYRAADYPGATLVADHSIYKIVPHFTVRQDAYYLTTDPFPAVYNWYSSGFKLGPERHAESGCILMAKSATTARMIESQMSVTLCDTPTGRMIFVMRSFSLHYR